MFSRTKAQRRPLYVVPLACLALTACQSGTSSTSTARPSPAEPLKYYLVDESGRTEIQPRPVSGVIRLSTQSNEPVALEIAPDTVAILSRPRRGSHRWVLPSLPPTEYPFKSNAF